MKDSRARFVRGRNDCRRRANFVARDAIDAAETRLRNHSFATFVGGKSDAREEEKEAAAGRVQVILVRERNTHTRTYTPQVLRAPG